MNGVPEVFLDEGLDFLVPRELGSGKEHRIFWRGILLDPVTLPVLRQFCRLEDRFFVHIDYTEVVNNRTVFIQHEFFPADFSVVSKIVE